MPNRWCHCYPGLSQYLGSQRNRAHEPRRYCDRPLRCWMLLWSRGCILDRRTSRTKEISPLGNHRHVNRGNLANHCLWHWANDSGQDNSWARYAKEKAFLARKLLNGIVGNGMNTATAPVWQAETSKAAWRGKLIVIELILNIAGFSLSNWVTYGFSFVDGPVSWRLPLAFQFIFIFVLFGTVPWLPESPRWLIAHDEIDAADQIIADLEAKDINDPWVITESKDIQWACQYEREHGVSWWDLMRGKTGSGNTSTVRRLVLGAGAQAMQQLAGINVTSYYLPTVLIQSVGLDEKLARLLAACNSVSYLLFSTIGIPNVEVFRPLTLLDQRF